MKLKTKVKQLPSISRSLRVNRRVKGLKSKVEGRMLTAKYLLVLMLGLGSLALAQQTSLELSGKASLVRSDQTTQSYTRSGGGALNLNLSPGDRLCVTEGKGKLVMGVRAFALEAGRTACFEVAKPKSFWDNLVASCQDIGVCKKQAEQAFVKEAKSRDLIGNVPILFVPSNYSLPDLTLTVNGGQVLRLLDASNKEVGRLEAKDSFTVPLAQLQKAVRLEVLTASEGVIYAAPLRFVAFDSEVSVNNPKESALQLWVTQNISYAPAAYSYLLASGDNELAKVLETQIRAEFKGAVR